MKQTEIEVERFGDDMLLVLTASQCSGFTRGADRQAVLLDRTQATALRDRINEVLNGQG